MGQPLPASYLRRIIGRARVITRLRPAPESLMLSAVTAQRSCEGAQENADDDNRPAQVKPFRRLPGHRQSGFNVT